MQLGNGLADDSQNDARFSLGEELLANELVQELAAFHEISHEEDVCAVIKDLNKRSHTQ